MCKFNSLTLVLVAASLAANSVNAYGDELTTAGGSKPLSTSDIQNVKIERERRDLRSRDASFSTAQSKNLGVSPAPRPKLPSLGISGDSKIEGNELSTARASKPVYTLSSAAGRDRGSVKPSRDASLSTADSKSVGESDLFAPRVPHKIERRNVGRDGAGFAVADAKNMECDPRMHWIDRNAKPSIGIAEAKKGSTSAELSSAQLVTKAANIGDAAGNLAEGELSGADVEPLSKPGPNLYWTRIAPADTHVMQMAISGWTVFSVVAAQRPVIEVTILDEDGNTLAEFDSTGCGAFLQVEPQMVTVFIHNTSRSISNEYVLNVYD